MTLKKLMANRALDNIQLLERTTTKLVNTAPSKQNCSQNGPKETSNNRSGALSEALSNRLFQKSGSPKHPATGTGPTEAVNTGPSKKKMMPNRALNNTQLPERATTQAVKYSKTKLLPNRAHGNIHQPEWACPEDFKTAPKKQNKKNTKAGPKHTHLPKRALSKLSRRVSPKQNCCLTGPSTTSNHRGGAGRILTTGAGPTEANRQDGPIPKRNCCRNGSTISNYWSGSLPKQSRRPPSKKKLLLKRVHGNIQLPQRAPAEAAKMDPSKKKYRLKRCLATFITETAPCLLHKFCRGRAPTKQKQLKSIVDVRAGPRQSGPLRTFRGSADPSPPPPWLRYWHVLKHPNTDTQIRIVCWVPSCMHDIIFIV